MSVRNRFWTAALCLGVSAGWSAFSLSADSAPTAVIAAAVADSARPEADRARDVDRLPAELVALTGIRPGSKVAEIMPGGGYFTRIFSKVVGPQGVVYAWVLLPPPNAAPGRDLGAPLRALAESGYPNVKVAGLDPAVPLPEQVDLVWTSLNYHDLHNRPNADLSATNRMALNALKPGGIYVVIDHAAEKGSGARDTSTLHRVDPELVRKEVTSVGFEVASESQLLRHAEDTHTLPSREVSRGKTDQFVFLFRKPKG
jgi:predicted methyltransferase